MSPKAINPSKEYQGWEEKYLKQKDGAPSWSETPQPQVKEFFESLSEKSLVVDLGAGDGRNSKVGLQNGHQVVLLDISKTALEIAVEGLEAGKFPKGLGVLGNLEDLPFSSSQFDGAICLDTLPQVFNLERAISEIHRILKPGGKCLLNVFTKDDCAWGEGERVGPSSYMYKGCYFSFFDDKDIPELCKGLFEVEDCRHFSWQDPPHVPFRPYEHIHDALFYVLKKNA